MLYEGNYVDSACSTLIRRAAAAVPGPSTPLIQIPPRSLLHVSRRLASPTIHPCISSPHAEIRELILVQPRSLS
jgi:hypothetical protein